MEQSSISISLSIISPVPLSCRDPLFRVSPVSEHRGIRAPSLPPAPPHHRRGLPVDEVPAPIILSPQNDTDVLTAISDIVDSIRGAEEPWSKSLLRAATFIADKITNGERDSNGNPMENPPPPHRPITHPAIIRSRNQSVEPSGLPFSGKGMKKSTSIGGQSRGFGMVFSF